MDETAILYSMPILRTLERRGASRVAIKNAVDTKKRLTAALTVGADGKKYPLFLILKGLLCPLLVGTKTGRIAQEARNQSTDDCVIEVNENAWMTNELFSHYWRKVSLFVNA